MNKSFIHESFKYILKYTVYRVQYSTVRYILIIKEVKIISVNVLINNQLDASFRLCGGRGRGGDVFVFVFIMFIMFIVYCVLFCILFLFVFFVFVFVRSEEAYFFKFTVKYWYWSEILMFTIYKNFTGPFLLFHLHILLLHGQL
jgi:hypothetical protein